jgi:AraC family transcriptional activator of mtrCDE
MAMPAQGEKVRPPDLDRMLASLEVEFVQLSECLVSPGWQLSLAPVHFPGIHYNLSGTGTMIVPDEPPIHLVPHTLIIVPTGKPFRLEAQGSTGPRHVDSRSFEFAPGTVQRFVAGGDAAEIVLICGHFRASYGAAIGLFHTLPGPIVERFSASDQLDVKLRSALSELASQEIGSGAMTSTLIKQVLIALMRRLLRAADRWGEHFALLADARIAKAFALMIAQPGAPHSVESLARAAALSRSTFMSRFTAVFGESPMGVLRQLRMRRARMLMDAGAMSVEQIALAVGYTSRGSFFRAYRKAWPSEGRPETSL